MRPAILFVCFFFVMGGAPLSAHRLEPISTEFAAPFEPRTGGMEIGYEYERFEGGLHTRHLIPEVELELGLTPRTQLSFEMPQIREKFANEPATVGGGHLEAGFRYLFAGGPLKSYAISINPRVEVPSGNRRIAGDATEVGLFLHFDKAVNERVVLHGNYGWSSTIGGSEPPERLFRYHSAAVFRASLRWNPVLEILGSTDTARGRTELAIQPEVIFWAGPHLELKFGMPFGLTEASPRIGARAQIAIIFGRKDSR